MKIISEWKEHIQWLGRVMDCDGKVYFDWTNSGFRFIFTGTFLAAKLEAVCETEQEEDPAHPGKNRENRPYAAVFYDDSDEPYSVFEIKPSERYYLLFASDTEETHVITLRKLTENAKGKLACSGFTGEGRIGRAKEEPGRLRIDFIGDSITCGFGNMSNERDRGFYSSEENGWLTYGAETGRILDADVSTISCSGISLSDPPESTGWPLPGMGKIVEYTDWFLEEKLGRKIKEKWNFKDHPRDIVVVNLGTNDSAMIDLFMRSMDEKQFEENYRLFLRRLRTAYGEKTWILCTLGPIDYYLYDNIRKAVHDHIESSGDRKVRCFKFMKARASEGIGASGHPTVKTQRRMGQELAGFIRTLAVKAE